MTMPSKTTRIYVDTSVIGGGLDEEFQTPSTRLFDRCRKGNALLVISDITLAELASAPAEVRKVVEDLPSVGIRSPLEVWKDENEDV